MVINIVTIFLYDLVFSLLHCFINYIVSTFKIIHMYILLFIIIRDEFDSTYAGLAAYTSGPKSTGVREIEFSKPTVQSALPPRSSWQNTLPQLLVGFNSQSLAAEGAIRHAT
jgi:hypothetical protein